MKALQTSHQALGDVAREEVTMGKATDLIN
jgi:hypothetical protein